MEKENLNKRFKVGDVIADQRSEYAISHILSNFMDLFDIAIDKPETNDLDDIVEYNEDCINALNERMTGRYLGYHPDESGTLMIMEV